MFRFYRRNRLNIDIEFPTTVKLWLEALSRTPQSSLHHSEGDCLVHTIIVTNRAFKSNDLTLIITAIFHDLGKAVTTAKNKKGNWAAHGHEKYSVAVVEECQDWITEVGVNWEDVKWLVENHMRIKNFDEMTKKKQIALSSHPLFEKLKLFNSFDNMSNLTTKEMVEYDVMINILPFLFFKFIKKVKALFR